MSLSLMACAFRKFKDRCEDIFQQIITDDGLFVSLSILLELFFTTFFLDALRLIL